MDLIQIIHKHQLWLSSLEGGERAVFHGEYFQAPKVVGGSLRRSIFIDCDFDASLLTRIDFSGANLTGTSFNYAKLYDCDFSNATLTNTSFNGTAFNKRPPTLDKTILKVGGVSAEIGKGISKLNCLKRKNSFWLLAPTEAILELGFPKVWWEQHKSLIQLAIMLKDLE